MVSQITLADLKGPKGKYNLHYGWCTGRPWSLEIPSCRSSKEDRYIPVMHESWHSFALLLYVVSVYSHVCKLYQSHDREPGLLIQKSFNFNPCIKLWSSRPEIISVQRTSLDASTGLPFEWSVFQVCYHLFNTFIALAK